MEPITGNFSMDLTTSGTGYRCPLPLSKPQRARTSANRNLAFHHFRFLGYYSNSDKRATIADLEMDADEICSSIGLSTCPSREMEISPNNQKSQQLPTPPAPFTMQTFKIYMHSAPKHRNLPWKYNMSPTAILLL
ncbi:hypothetical protein CEXT_521781 [Caerostris extrusa]|uniref:Uncharacterized protein n=1 Tax=Caerostris extrusa TaxID=172846 RepID=A0AAV4VA34_CAEEX|nr:hypothetical protein CEXT_521781 [Caerostris extrusa]